MISAIITAAGSGSRMQAPQNKVFLPLAGKPILYWTLQRLLQTPSLFEILIVYHPRDEFSLQELLQTITTPIPIKLVRGGDRRQDSLANGARASHSETELLLLHDAVRPFCRRERLQEVCDAALQVGAALLAEPVSSTVKQKEGQFLKTLDRSQLYLAQTPQVIRRSLYLHAIETMYQENWEVTDDISLIEKLNLPIQLVMGDSYNIKITYPTDLPLAHFIQQHHFSSDFS